MESDAGRVYLLSDGNHGNELLARLNTFFQQEKFTDIHLLASDGTEVKAHKVLLASCSPLFQDAINCLGNTSIIYLKGNVEYCGEFNILIIYIFAQQKLLSEQILLHLITYYTVLIHTPQASGLQL